MYPFFGSTCVLVRDILNTYALLNLSKNSSAFIITKNQKLAINRIQNFFKNTGCQPSCYLFFGRNYFRKLKLFQTNVHNIFFFSSFHLIAMNQEQHDRCSRTK